MAEAVSGSDGIQSLHTAAGICLASPLAACLVLTDGRVQVFNDAYRALVGTAEGLKTFAAGWGASISGPLAAAIAGTPALVQARLASGETRDTMLSLTPVRESKNGSICGVFVLVIVQSEQKPAAELLDSFRYTLSHDLLSPLRTLREVARVLEGEHARDMPPDAAVLLSHFEQGTHKLVDRVEALVRLLRVSEQPLDCRRVDVSALVTELASELRAAHGNKATVVIGELPDAQADAELARVLFGTLLSNAFKFSRNVGEPRIEIGSEPARGMNAYFVMDNGAGFDMKYAGKLFGLFQRMHGEAQFEGTGAGLAIARRIVERHGGTIRAEATKDQGAKLSFTLPPASTEPSPDA